jgi:hypothetical protein
MLVSWAEQSVTLYIVTIVLSLAIPKATAKLELLLNKVK